MKRVLGIVASIGMTLLFILLAVQRWGYEKGTASFGGNLPSMVDFWHLRDCPLPCWAGVEIGTTPLTVAYRRVQSLYAGYQMQGKNDTDRFELTIFDVEGRALGTIFAYASVGVVQRITLDMAGDKRLSLGDSLAIYGQPTCAAPSLIIAGIDTVVLDEQPSGIRIYNVVRRRNIQYPLEQLVFVQTNNGRRLCGNMYKRWHGFTYP
jgi:hypothetical protein